MNEENTNVEAVEEEVTTEQEVKEQKQEPEKKYTDEDVDLIIDKKFAKWQAEQEAKIQEEKKLAEMNAEEKQAHELKKAQDKIAEYERKEAFNETFKEVSRMLSEESISLSESVVSLLVQEDAEATKATVESFIDEYRKAVESGVRTQLSGSAPKSFQNTPKPLDPFDEKLQKYEK